MAEDVGPSSEVAMLLGIGRRLCSEPTSEALFQTILEDAVALIGADGGTIYVYDSASDSLVFKFVISSNPDVANRLKGLTLKRGVGIVGQVAETLVTDLVADTRCDPRFAKDIDRKTGFETNSALTVPLHFFDDESQSRTLVGVLQLVNKKSGTFTESDVRKMEAFGGFAAALLTRANLFQRIRRQFLGTIASLAEAVDAKDPYTHGHSQRVAAYSVALGAALGLSRTQLFSLRVSSLLHDIGKIAIPDAILQKQAKLTDDEYARIQTHSQEGVRILRPVNMSAEVYEGILHHHEKWDGSGYPNKRKGNEIPLFGRIVAFADALDTITTERPYKKARSFEEARRVVLQDAGMHFDPDLAPTFCGLPHESILNALSPFDTESSQPS